MKKILMAAAAAAVLLLGSCGGSGSASSSAAPPVSSAKAEATETKETETEETRTEETKTEETKTEETKTEETGTAAAALKGGMEGGSELHFTTGGNQGTYYGFGCVLAKKVGETTDTIVTAIPSGGSVANIEAMDAGDADLGFVQSDVIAYAREGIRLFEDIGPVDSFSAVAALYMEQVQIVTLDESIKSIADLKGRNVSIGAAGSGVYFSALDCLSAYGLTEDDINPAYQSFSDSAEALLDGKIDAAFVVAGAPTTAVTALAEEKKIFLVGIDDGHMEKLSAASPYYSRTVIPKEVYNTPEDVPTAAVGAVIVADNDVPGADVYNFLYGVFEHTDEIMAEHEKGAELDLAFASSVTSVPYHPGAKKYFAEKGINLE